MKHSKLFLTGMAALLLSFGLMMTGCDSGGDSDSDTTINAADYIEITAGVTGVTGSPGTAATFTVTVKNPLEATKKATFTKVATNDVVYIGGTGGTAKEAQATAIAAALNAAPGAKYDAAVGTTVGTDDHIITLTQKTPYGPVDAANKPAVAVTAYTAPVTNDVSTAAAIDVAENDTALAVIATGGSLKTGLKVFISTDGATVTITTATSVDGAFAPATGATVAQDGLKIIVKGLAVAAANPTNNNGATALKSGSGTVTVTLKGDAQATQVTSVAAKTSVPVVLGDQAAYEFVSGATAGADKILFATNPLSLQISNGAATPIDADIDAELIGYLTALKAVLTSASVGTFKVAGGAGAITEIATVAAATVPAGTNLFVPGADVKVPAAAVTVTGTLTIGTATNNVSITKGTYTAAGAGTLGVGATGVVTMADGDTLALLDGGKIEIAGTGKIVVGATTIDGVGAWTATLGTGATIILITSAATGAIITAPSGTAASTLAASGTAPAITQAAGTASNVLDIGAFITIDLQGTNAALVGAIKMVENSNPATLKLAGATTIIKTGNTGSTEVTPNSSNSTGITTGSAATGKPQANAAANFTVTTAGTTAASAYLVSIAGTATAAGILTAYGSSGGGPTVIDAAFCVDADGT
jgi:hypothetical protein